MTKEKVLSILQLYMSDFIKLNFSVLAFYSGLPSLNSREVIFRVRWCWKCFVYNILALQREIYFKTDNNYH